MPADVACILDGSEPTLLSRWFEQLPSEHGVHLILGVPRYSITLLSRTATLTAQPIDERVDFERECLKLALVNAWPGRLARLPPGRTQIGAELYRLACMTLLGDMQAVSSALTLLQAADGAGMLLDGWAWPIALCAIPAATRLRPAFVSLIRRALSPLDACELDNIPIVCFIGTR